MGSLNNAGIWYLMRGSGIVTLVLFTAVVVLGIATTKRMRIGTMPRFVTLALHRSVSLLACAFLGIHIVTAVTDSYAKVALPQLFVPYPTSSYNLYLGLGALSFDLLIAVVVTSLLRHRLTQRVWKGIHWFAYASWPLAFAHSIGIGTDSDSVWLVGTALACLGAVAAAGAWRLLASRQPYPKYLGAPL